MYFVSSTMHNFGVISFKNYTKDLVSIIIPVHAKRKDLLRTCLEQVLKQTYKNTEIIIVNNGIKEFEELIREYNSSIGLTITNERNLGASYARNQGALRSKGEFLWFVDSDVYEIPSDCLHFMVNTVSNNSDVGSIGGIVGRSNDEQWLFLSRDVERNFLQNKEKYNMYEDEYVNTASILIPRTVFARVNGFTDYIEYIHDDVDLGFKILKSGFKCIVDHRALSFHHIPGPSHDFTYYKLWYTNSILFYLVNYNLIEFVKFLKYKFDRFTQNRSMNKEDKRPDSLHRTLALSYSCLFLLFHLPKVLTLRRERQSLIKHIVRGD